MEVVVTGDADDFGKTAIEIDLNSPPSDYNLGGQLEGLDRILENDEVTFVLYLRQIKVV